MSSYGLSPEASTQDLAEFSMTATMSATGGSVTGGKKKSKMIGVGERARTPLCFKTVSTPADDMDRLTPQANDFKADRMAKPKDVASEMKANMSEYIRTLNYELRLAKKLQMCVDDVGAVIDHGATFGREITGTSVVDMQILLYNTRNMNKLKERFVHSYKLDNTDLQQTAKRLREQMAKELQSPTFHKDGTSMPRPFEASRRSDTNLDMIITRNVAEMELANATTSTTGCPRCTSGMRSLQDEVDSLKKQLRHMENVLSRYTPPQG
mmetsp:Transcript_42626/g.106637  ORF Transcript_42626/g.106637 Transcript_42626/m.106637 type:complete len:267 (+) Transcript_42626:168-968(+)